jgi:hypothetical protein
MRKIKTIVLGIRNEYLREKVMDILSGLRTIIGNITRFYRINIKSSTKSSAQSYGDTDLIQDIKNKYNNKDMLKEIEPPYFLQISFYNFILQNYYYKTCIEIGSYKGELLNILASNNKNINFIGYDINENIKEIDNYYQNTNLSYRYYKPMTSTFLKLNEGGVLC